MKSLFSSNNWKSWNEIGDPLYLPNLRLISIHVEKTAGPSFYHELITQYGSEGVLRMDTHQHDFPYFNQEAKIDLNTLANIEVLHGHFTKEDLKKFVSYSEDQVQIISWIRDPAQRILSNYNHLSTRLKEYVNSQKSPQLLEKMMRSFEEFIRADINQNRMSLYLEDYAKEELSFVGQVENYNSDLEKIATLLHWDLKKINFSRLNDSTKIKQEINAAEMQLIQSLNERDYQLYERLKDQF